MNYLLAVSGGVDSVVLLDMFSRSNHHIIVAHVDHGIRGDESAADARFVKLLAQQYGVPFVSAELHLTEKASEETARLARYNFLFTEAAKHHATVVTAHHQDDTVETIAVNITRGTGWRGLAVLNRQGIVRPLLGFTKQHLYDYALAHHLEWVEDATNRQTVYLRNQLRHLIGGQVIDTAELMRLRARQIQLGRDIDSELARLVSKYQGSRYFVRMISEAVAVEIVGTEIARVSARPTRPRLVRAIHAIKTAPAGSVHQVGDGVILEFTARNYTVRVVQLNKEFSLQFSLQ